MAQTTGDIIVQTLMNWGVDTIFGIPGDGINGIIEALRKNQDKIKFIQTRHEEAAAFAACGYAKVTGRLGVCLATSGPGGIHLLNGLYDAKLDGQPVLAITGLQFHDLIGTHTQQDVALDRLFLDVALYSERIMGAAHAENVTEFACRIALARRGVSHITIPTDIQEQTIKEDIRSKRNKPQHVSDEFSIASGRANPRDLEEAAAILNDRIELVRIVEIHHVREIVGLPIVIFEGQDRGTFALDVMNLLRLRSRWAGGFSRSRRNPDRVLARKSDLLVGIGIWVRVGDCDSEVGLVAVRDLNRGVTTRPRLVSVVIHLPMIEASVLLKNCRQIDGFILCAHLSPLF